MGAVITTLELEFYLALKVVTSRARLSFSGKAVRKLHAVRNDLKTELLGDAVEDADNVLFLCGRVCELAKSENASASVRCGVFFGRSMWYQTGCEKGR